MCNQHITTRACTTHGRVCLYFLLLLYCSRIYTTVHYYRVNKPRRAMEIQEFNSVSNLANKSLRGLSPNKYTF